MIRAILLRLRAPLLVAVVTAGMFFGIKARYGSYGDYYYLTVEAPRAGQLMRVGADVRERGVLIGTVSDIRLVDREVEMTLRIQQQYDIPADAEAVVDLKTLLGDKFVDLRSEGWGPPFLEDGDRIQGHVGPELEDALQAGVQVFESIDPQDAASLVSELAQGARGHGEDVARGIEANARLSTVFRRTLEPQLRALRDFEVIFRLIKDRADDLNRLADAVNEGVPVYASERAQRSLGRVLAALVPMSQHLSDLLIAQREDWDRLIDKGDVVLQTIVERTDGLRDLVHGAYRYVFKLGAPPPQLPDGSAMAPFTNFFGGEEFEQEIAQVCGAIPPAERELILVCGGEGP